MKLVRQVRLELRQAESVQTYEIDLCRLSNDRYTVNFRYQRGSSFANEGTRTPVAVSEEDGLRIFQNLLDSQQDKGYQIVEDSGQPAASEAGPGGSGSSDVPPSSSQAPPKPKPPKPEPPANDPAVIAVLDRIVQGDRTASRWKLSRAVWRCGQMGLREAEPYLLALLGSGNAMRDYCLVWALAQCGTPKSVAPLEAVEADEQAEGTVRRLAAFAIREVAAESQRESLLRQCLETFPEQLRTLASQGPAEQFEAALPEYLEGADANQHAVLEMAYYLDSPQVRPGLLAFLRTTRFQPHAFQRVRHIFKVAEMRRDEEVLGILSRRFETTFGNLQMQPEWYYPNKQKPTVGPNPRSAYSRQTRDYLRRRVWRTLRQFGEMKSSEYCRLAVGILSQITDEDGQEPRRYPQWRWDPERRRHIQHPRHYDRFSEFYVFNQILYQHSPRYTLEENRLRFLCVNYEPGQATPPVREEAFPELWDSAPERVVGLLLQSRCAPVHSFGVKVLEANSEFLIKIPMSALISLLGTIYETTVRFAFQIARDRFDIDNPDARLLLALADCNYEPGREQAYEWLRACRARVADEELLWAGLVVSRQQTTRRVARELLLELALNLEDTQKLLARIVASIMTLEDPDIARDATETLLIVFPEPLKKIGEPVLQDLISHPLAAVQRFAGELILRHEQFSQHPPIELLKRLLDSDYEPVRSVAVRIITQLKDSVLLESVELLTELTRHELPDVRSLVRPTIQRLAQANEAFAKRMATRLVAALLVPGAPEGVPSHTAMILREDLREFLEDIPPETVWKLLMSRSEPAQEVGGILLATNVDPQELELDELVRLCHHKVLAVRESGREMCRRQKSRFRDDSDAVAMLVDSPWEDTRQFAFAWVRENFSAEGALPPEALIAICDSIRPDVQQFGRQLVMRLFDDAHGEQYLLKLSEHPSESMQLFVSNFLDQHAADQPEILARLSLYFVTVLSRVNKAGVAKTRALDVLEREGLKSEQAARVAADILARLSATTAILNRGRMIEIMTKINSRYPDVQLPIEKKPLEVRGGV